jgi:hypothetical protein
MRRCGRGAHWSTHGGAMTAKSDGEGELKSEGERCGVLRGWSSPFIGTGGASGRQ